MKEEQWSTCKWCWLLDLFSLSRLRFPFKFSGINYSWVTRVFRRLPMSHGSDCEGNFQLFPRDTWRIRQTFDESFNGTVEFLYLPYLFFAERQLHWRAYEVGNYYLLINKVWTSFQKYIKQLCNCVLFEIRQSFIGTDV